MAVLKFNRKDLENLLGKSLSDEEYMDRIPMMGTPLEGIDKDELEIEIFPNRPDLLSIEGFARALKTFLGKDKQKKYDSNKGEIKLKNSNPKARPYVTGGVIRNVNISEDFLKALMDFQEKIHETFGRKRKKVAIGIHDLDKVNPPFEYKEVKPGSVSFIPLEEEVEMDLNEILDNHKKGKEYAHILKDENKYPIITDSENNVLSFPPIINGDLTRVTENSKNIFIDVTGTDEEAINQVLNILVCAFADRGADIESIEINGKRKPHLKQEKMKLDIDYVNTLLNLDLKGDEVKPYLEKMGFEYLNGEVYIPPYRTDIIHMIDIVEDIAIAYGYENFSPEIPKIPTEAERNENEETAEEIRDAMSGLGFLEVVNFILTNPENHFNKMNVEEEPTAKIMNPTSELYTICRKSLLPGLLKVISENKHRSFPQKIFETGLCADEKGEQYYKFSAAITHPKASYKEIAYTLGQCCKELDLNLELKKTKHDSFLEGRTAEIIINGNSVGTIGEVHPIVLENWYIDNPVLAFEIEI